VDGRWLTYAELAGELGTSAEGARRRAQRGRWTRQRGNDGLARVLVPEDALDGQRPVRAPSVRSDRAGASSESLSLIEALRAHVATLEEQLAAAEARASEDTAALREHNATLKAELEHRGAEIDTLKAQLAASEERTTATEARVTAADARASEESAKTAQAIAAFEGLAQRLEAMAEARRPLWHRLLWRG
jgi:chromosome segregation ATPase